MAVVVCTTSSFLSSSTSSSSLCFRLNPLLFSTTRRRRRSTTTLSRRFFATLNAEAESRGGIFTSPEVAKSFDFTNEERIYKWWESQGYFKPNTVKGSDPFVVPMPPPNVTGSLHMGHAMFVTLEDIMIRYNRMKGRPTLWLPGTDHAGIATQLVVERMLAAEGVKRADLGRDEFTKRVWEWKQKYGGTITNQIKRLGASCDWTRERFTLDEQLSRAVVEAFIRLHEKGLIYQGFHVSKVKTAFLASNHVKHATLRGSILLACLHSSICIRSSRASSSCPLKSAPKILPSLIICWRTQTVVTLSLSIAGISCSVRIGSYMVNWSPNLQTAVSDLEVEYSEEPGALYYIKYRVAGGSKSDFLTIATTRPETLFGDTAIAVNPQDERYSKYIGKQAIVPLTFGRHVPIISDKYVDKDFGTGVLKISPGHDHNDYLLARKLGLPILNVMNKDGTLNEVAGLYAGLDRFEARKKLWSDLEETGLAVKKEAHTSRVPRSQRGGEIIEPLVSKQWFVTMEPLAERALEAVSKGELTIMPERFEKIYKHWLSNIKDWCISRQLWWGHRIPVWYISGKDCEEDYIVARSHREAFAKAQEKYGKNVEIYQDPDVLDTWFSSSLWPFSTLGWPDESAEDFKRFYPTSVLETGHDILFFWVARMVMMGIEFTGTVPFSHIYLHGLIRDSQGRKMSKTLGNVIDPLDTIAEYGTDALRFTLALGTAGQDLNLSTERLTSNKAFTNKLWNAGKFILRNLPRQDDTPAWEALRAHKFDKMESVLKLPLPECWVVSKLHVLVDEVTASYEKFFLGDVGREIYDFFWSDFADWYIEASKARLYHSGDLSVASVSQAALLYIFENILKLLHPFMPFVTEELWQALPSRGEALIVSAWPPTSLPRNIDSIKKFENLQALTRAIRNVRAEYAVEPAKLISASIVANPDVIQYISGEKEVLALLSRLDLGNVNFAESPPGDANQSVHIVVGEGLEAYLPLSDMVDIFAEVQRLSRRLVKMQAEYDGLMARLSSSSVYN
ncbi:valine--tRNA ligase, chloroplastic/mitochondrial 2 isoform X3 [Lycium barbarum]|uniref:valine--tRNA ligase, chloroplastic/mitochondrial 2 isoform X3 n=1 Tax=Lycium barbarum TaxID=112863 RepID=UPI00293EA34C|nr:valine--tRNA ligase, chloroplastic/mitochondrial 2 isoform X3 [Lycium barbarum]